MIDHCIEVVRDANEAIEGNRIFGASDFIISARGVLEAERLLEAKAYDLAECEPGEVGDWALACVAEVLHQASAVLRERGNTAIADRFAARQLTMLRRIAESPWCSPLLGYGDVFSTLVDDCRRRRDPAGVTFQAGHLVHDLEHGNDANVMGGLRDLGWLHFLLGNQERATDIFTKLLRHDPTDVWTHNIIALTFARDLPQLARAAAARGLEITALGDVHKLARHFQRSVDELAGKPDGPGPANANALLDALRLAPAERKSLTLRKLCKAVAPETAHVQKKVREPLPDAEDLRQLREDLRSLPRPEPKALSATQAPRAALRISPVAARKLLGKKSNTGTTHAPARVSPPTARSAKIGRNDACPCGTGKKYKRCCGM